MSAIGGKADMTRTGSLCRQMTYRGRTVVVPSRSEQNGRARSRHSHLHQRKACQLLGYEPPHCGGEHGQEDNWHPYEPGGAGIFSAHNAIEQREAGQGKGCRNTSYERLLLYPSLGCEPWADRNTENKASSPAHPPRVCWHTWISAQLKHCVRHQKKAKPVHHPNNCRRSKSQARGIDFEFRLCHYQC